MAHQFNVYIDESGDEGFLFDEFPKGSSKWFIISALIVHKDSDKLIRDAVAGIRKQLGFAPKHILHFSDLDHERRVHIAHQIASLPVCVSSVIVHKEAITKPEIFKGSGFRLYFYATRLLLERVSWYCRDRAAQLKLDGCEAKLTFEHRRRLSYDDLRAYLNTLKGNSEQDEWLKVLLHDVRIYWPSIDVDGLKSIQKGQSSGLQLADSVARALSA